MMVGSADERASSHSRMHMSLRGVVLGCVLALVGSSCSNTGPARVKGKITYGDHSFTNWELHLVTVSTGSGTSSVMESDGSFLLADRLDPNQTYVAFFTEPEPGRDATGAPRPRLVADPPIPAKYHSYKTSDLKVEVAPGKNYFDLSLQD